MLSGWVTVGSAIVAALLGAAVGGYLRDFLAEKYFRPKLAVDGKDSIQKGDVLYYRVFIRNKGKRAATNCIGQISLPDVRKKDIQERALNIGASIGTRPIITRDTFTEIKEMSICWSRLSNPENMVVNRGARQALDFFRVVGGSKDARIEFPTENGWKPKVRVWLVPREYKGCLTVTGANCEPLTKAFRLIPGDTGVRIEFND
jgi:hypothetical protein